MDVTRNNFKELLPRIKQSIDNATFIAIDCELTGLNNGNKINSFDTQKQYYEKIKQGAQNYIIIQFGLCLFKYDEEAKVFKQNCYNFYIFPQQQDRNIPDKRFLCQASSIDFLIGNNFDFNKLFKEGITYLNKDEETRCLEMLLEKQKMRANQLLSTPARSIATVSVPEEDKEFIEKNIELIDAFISSTEDEVMLPKCNGFLRKLMYQTIEERYGNDVCLETRIQENKERILYAIKTTGDKKAEREKERCEKELLELKDSVGFSIVAQHIADSGKLVVGHNFLLDILHVVDKFMTPVPSDYDDFKECINCLFPRILDTKLMASSFPFKESIPSTVLGHIVETISNEPYTIPAIEIDSENGDCGYSLHEEKRYHEAGYDAYITGICFLAMSQYLGKLEKTKNVILPDSKLVKPFMNKIHLMKVQDIAYINLDGKDVIPPRDHILHLTFPKEWKTSDIVQLFSPFGNVHIGWIDDGTAYVALKDQEQAIRALHALQGSRTCSAVSYARHQSHAEGNAPLTPSPYVYRKKIISENNVTRKRKLHSEELATKRMYSTAGENQECSTAPKSKTPKTFLEDSTWD